MKRELKVGAFVLVGLVLTGVVIFIIGQERRVFARRVEYTATFPDVQGLKVGAPVRLSGVDIGTVKSISHSESTTDDRLYVKLDIVRDEAVRIRVDSIAKVANKGMLGDKMLEISTGTTGKPQIPPGGTIPSEDPADFSTMLGRLGDMAKKTENVITNLDKATGTFAEDGTRKDLKEGLHSVTIILDNMAQGRGYAGKLMTDPQEAERISQAFQRFDQTLSKMNKTLDGLNHVLDRVNNGPGLLHSLVYEDSGKKSIESIGHASEEVALLLHAMRDGNGVAKTMLLGGPGQEAMSENLLATSKDLRVVMANVRAGKGTVGGLLVDPSLYEDMKRLVGDVSRNDVLRALVRYSIKEDEKRTPPAVEKK